MTTYYGAIWAVFAMVFFAGGVVRWHLIRRLHSRHPDTWHDLGDPTLWNGNIRRFTSEFAFIFKLRFLNLHDATLNYLGFISLILATALWLLFLILVAMLLGIWR